ncbi:hypothetical protein GCM10010329_23490 [Streptomyces spiroverticillatus]|uniref:ParB-like N-terminal domain-containing protein n=1 Tax=Streptomyces finlayi TaxID=67296 RepID=A0A918WUM6_9ACTN|nr:hypothetical protein GCM10010329_23490 [Streptomyces spiroverticillatus]GHC85590.1 hypothetical protein GCM10010334_15910 [Streptomyces finlayi]
MKSTGRPDASEQPWSKSAQEVRTDQLLPSDSPRGGACDENHVLALAGSGREFEPLLVHRPTMRVIDGMHRLSAARLRGYDTVAVRFFDGSQADAYVLSVQLNIRHGLPLSRAERRAAAERIVRTHPHWSDRAIAERTGLSGKTVGRLRGSVSEEIPQSHTRVGRDGTLRPLNSRDGRLRAAGPDRRRPHRLAARPRPQVGALHRDSTRCPRPAAARRGPGARGDARRQTCAARGLGDGAGRCGARRPPGGTPVRGPARGRAGMRMRPLTTPSAKRCANCSGTLPSRAAKWDGGCCGRWSPRT